MLNRGDQGAGVPEWTPEGVYNFCRNRSNDPESDFLMKPDQVLEQEWECQFLQK